MNTSSYRNTISLAILVFVTSLGQSSPAAWCQQGSRQSSLFALISEGSALAATGSRVRQNARNSEHEYADVQARSAETQAETKRLAADSRPVLMEKEEVLRSQEALESTRAGVDRTDVGAVANFNARLSEVNGNAKRVNGKMTALVDRYNANAAAIRRIGDETIRTFRDLKEARAALDDQVVAERAWRRKVLNLSDLQHREALSRAAAESTSLEQAVEILKRVWDGAQSHATLTHAGTGNLR